jgi:hypothetical protein
VQLALSQVGDSGNVHDPRLGLRIGIQVLPSHMLADVRRERHLVPKTQSSQ